MSPTSNGGTEFLALVVALREVSDREPLGTDISDYSDEFCEGFLAGQSNALDALIERVQIALHDLDTPYVRPADDPHTLVAKALDGSL